MVEINNIVLIYTIVGIICIFGLLLLAFAINLKFIKIGWRIRQGGAKSALMFLKPEKGDLEGPYAVKISENAITLKEGHEKRTYPYSGQIMEGAKMFGKPWFIYDITDAKVSNGIYYHQTQIKEINGKKESEPINGTFQYSLNGKSYTVKDHPFLLPEKNSVVNPPKLVQAVIATEILSGMTKEFFMKYKNIFYMVAGVLVGLCIIIYLVYDWLPTKIADIITTEVAKLL